MGLLLLVLAFVLFPIKIDVKVEGSMMGETEEMGFGWLFVPVLAAWAFASMILSAVENFGGGRVSKIRLLPAFLILYLLLCYGGWMAIRFGAEPFWWANFAAIAASCALATLQLLFQFG